ncbi:MAG TPA: cytochrome c [Chitinophagaceae bacterium]|nr:cytochrome c [Chitinophagaceae bacterium]
MKKFFILGAFGASILVLTNCSSTKKTASAPPVAKVTYTSNVQAAIAGNCSPCHIPSKGGNKKAYDNYANVKTDIDEIIRRIELQPTDRGFMPFKHPRLSDSTINVFKQFRTDGALEK